MGFSFSFSMIKTNQEKERKEHDIKRPSSAGQIPCPADKKYITISNSSIRDRMCISGPQSIDLSERRVHGTSPENALSFFVISRNHTIMQQIRESEKTVSQLLQITEKDIDF